MEEARIFLLKCSVCGFISIQIKLPFTATFQNPCIARREMEKTETGRETKRKIEADKVMFLYLLKQTD